MDTPTLRERLRSATRAEHEALEQDLDLLRPDLTLSRYASLLARFHGFYQPWESRLMSHADSALQQFYSTRQKLSLLEADLRYLEIDPARLPLCPRLPCIESTPAALGSLYVIEGSTLGGQLLTRHLRPLLHLEEGGLQFFASYGDRVGPSWRAFLQLLEQHSNPIADEQMIDSARSTFVLMSNWLTGAPV